MRRLWILITFLAVLIAVSFYVVFCVNPVVIAYSEAHIRTLTIRAVNQSVSAVMTPGTYSQLTNVQRDQNGAVASVTSNIELINALAGNIAHESQLLINDLAHGGLSVPIGTFSGLPFLAGRGSDARLGIVPLGAVYCAFNTEFIGRGINQTVHKIILNARSTVSLIMPLGSRQIETEIDVLLCENVIVGAVPEFFLAK
jgi:sporulation protein YunB